MATYVEYRVVGASKVQNFLCNIFLQLTCHYFWPRLIALPKNALPICKDTGILFHYWCCKIQNEEEIWKTDLEPAKKTQFIYCVFDIGKLLLLLLLLLMEKNREKKKIQNPWSKKENIPIVFVTFAKCCCYCCSLQKPNPNPSKQARKHSIMLCDILLSVVVLIVHCKKQIQASKKTHNCALWNWRSFVICCCSLQKPNPNPTPRSKASTKTNNVVLWHLQSVVVVHYKNEIQIHANKQAWNTHNLFLWQLQIVVIVVAHYKIRIQIQASKKTHNCVYCDICKELLLLLITRTKSQNQASKQARKQTHNCVCVGVCYFPQLQSCVVVVVIVAHADPNPQTVVVVFVVASKQHSNTKHHSDLKLTRNSINDDDDDDSWPCSQRNYYIIHKRMCCCCCLFFFLSIFLLTIRWSFVLCFLASNYLRHLFAVFFLTATMLLASFDRCLGGHTHRES